MGARLHSGEGDPVVNHEINVTPFIDVMLVLLIIFMVAAPLATVEIPLDLPVSTAQPQPKPDDPLFLSLQADLSLSVNDQPVTQAGLGRALEEAAGGNKDIRIFLRSDKTVSYGELMKVMNGLRDAGFVKVALVGIENAPGAGAAP